VAHSLRRRQQQQRVGLEGVGAGKQQGQQQQQQQGGVVAEGAVRSSECLRFNRQVGGDSNLLHISMRVAGGPQRAMHVSAVTFFHKIVLADALACLVTW
jgi:hypothetical protein